MLNTEYKYNFSGTDKMILNSQGRRKNENTPAQMINTGGFAPQKEGYYEVIINSCCRRKLNALWEQSCN